MSLFDELSDKKEKLLKHYREDGLLQAVKASVRYGKKRLIYSPIRAIVRAVAQPPIIYVHSRLAPKLNVFNEDWDLLIILDTCRVDAIEHVAPEYDFIDEVGTRWSVGSQSAEWITNTFDRRFQDEIADTAYITSNPHAYTVLDSRFEEYKGKKSLKKSEHSYLRRISRYSVSEPVEVDSFHSYTRLYDASIDYGKTEFPDPRAVTDHVIKIDREDDPNRIIAHYMPPHAPYLAKVVDGEIEITDKPRSRTDFNAYLDNLRWGLNEVEILLENVNRDRVVISADHGENFFMRSIRVSHGVGAMDPTVRRVPWVETEAVNRRTYKPDINTARETSDREEMLEALGYL